MIKSTPLALRRPIHAFARGIGRRDTCPGALVVSGCEFLLPSLGDGARLCGVGVGRAISEGVYVAAEGFAYAVHFCETFLQDVAGLLAGVCGVVR